MPKRRRHIRRTQAEWEEILGRFASSSLSVGEFCQREGVSQSGFQRWRCRLGKGQSARFVELVPTSPASAPSADWSLDVALPNGVQLRFRG
jgi:hypothetical protein